MKILGIKAKDFLFYFCFNAWNVVLLFLLNKFLFFYMKPSSRPNTKSFFILGHIVVLKVSLKFLNFGN